MAGQDSTVILRVQLDEQATEKRIGEITVAVTENRKAQQELKKAYDAGKVSADEFGQRSVKLNSELRMQQTEQRNLTKNLDLYRAAVNGVAGSYDQAQAQLTLAQRQFRGLEGSLEDTTEASQALSGVVRDLRGQLKETDANSLDQFFRSIGDYPKPESLTPLIQQLVKLEETVKSGALTAEQAAQADAAVIGYKQRIAQAGAQEGKSYEETTALVKSYGDAIRPATAELLKLEAEQRQVVESGKATGEQVAQIGFRFGAAKKQIADATDALKEVPAAAEDGAKETKGLGAGLLDAARSSDKLGGAVEVLTTAKEKYTAAAELAKVATAGEVTVLGALKLALLATGLGALVVVLGLVISGLSKSQAVTDLLSRKMAALGGFIQPVINLGAELGEKLVAAADNPKQAFSDLVDFIGTNLLNRLKGFVQIVQDVSKGNYGKLADDFIQIGTGITDATAKAKAFSQEMVAAASSAEAIEKEAQRIREAERALNVERDQSRAKIEGLKKASDDTNLSVAARTAAAKEAARIENALLAEQLKLQDDKVRNLRAEQALKKSLSTEDKDKLAELLREQANVQQESLTLQTELQNKINSLVQEGYDKSIAGRAQALALEKALLDKQLAQVQVNSEKELSIRQLLLNNARVAELNVKNLTVAQKKAIDVKYEQESQALLLNSIKARALAAYDAEAASINRELALVKSGTDEETELRRETIRTQLAAQKAALDVRKDNAQQIALLDANAAKAIESVSYEAALSKLEKFLADQRQALEDANSRGLLTEKAYTKAVLANDSIAAGTRLALAKDYHQETLAQERAAKDAQIAIQKQLTDEERASVQERKEIARNFGEEVGSLIADNLLEQGANIESFLGKVMILVLDVIEKQLIAQQIASVGSASVQAIAQPDSVATFGASGFARIAILTAAITAAFELAKAGITAVSAPPKQFAQGTVLSGPSHAQGGVQLYGRGHWFGEAEGGEAVINKRSTALFLPVLSAINQAGGGRALTPNLSVPRMALGGMAYPALAQQQLQGGAGAVIDYNQMARAFEKVTIEAKISAIEKASKQRANTIKLAND